MSKDKLATNETSKKRKDLGAVVSSMPAPPKKGRQWSHEKPPTSAGKIKR